MPLSDLMQRYGLTVDVRPGRPPYMGADPVVFVTITGRQTAEVLTFPVRPGAEISPSAALCHVLALARLAVGPFIPARGSVECCRALDTALGTVGYVRLATDLAGACPLWATSFEEDHRDLWARH